MKTHRKRLPETRRSPIDGRKLACASKMVQESGGEEAKDFAVLDVYRNHREFKPRGIAELNQAGKQLARVLAEEAAEVVDSLGHEKPLAGIGEGRQDG